jgi:hypothetical protein
MGLVLPWWKNVNMCDDMALKKIFGPKKDEMGCLVYYETKEFFCLYGLPSVVRVVKSTKFV